MQPREALKKLGLKEGAQKAEIKKAFRELAKKHHPDKSSQTDTYIFTQLVEAYNIALKNSGSKKDDPVNEYIRTHRNYEEHKYAKAKPKSRAVRDDSKDRVQVLIIISLQILVLLLLIILR